jgi:hypothetical protein
MDWRDVAGNWIVVPPRPKAIVHFLGGAFVAAAPHVTYRMLLESLAEAGYAVVATPFVNTFDHVAIARQVILAFDRALDYLYGRVFQQRYVPIYGLGHSMGCKLHLLIGSLYEEERAGNIFMAYNNYPARRSIPLLEQFSQVTLLNVEFSPSPEETEALVLDEYRVQRNLLVKFTQDNIDQTRSLSQVMQRRCPQFTTVQILPGNHLTPLGQDIRWQPSDAFSPLDAIGQLVKQEVYKDFNQLKKNILLWLDPVSAGRSQY